MNKIILILLFTPLAFQAQNLDFDRAVQLYEQQRLNQAKSIFEALLKDNPNHLPTLEYLGNIASYKRDWDTAIEYYRILIDKEPNNANFNFKYGGVLGRKAQNSNRFVALRLIGSIKTHLEKAAQLDPNHIDVRWALVDFNLALPAIAGGSVSTARRYAQEIYRISKLDGNIVLGNIELYSNNQDKAKTHFLEALRLANSNSAKLKNNHYFHLGKISALYDMNHQQGLAFLNHYIKNHSVKDGVGIEKAHYNIAKIYRLLNNKEQALNHINIALQIQPDFSEATQERRRIQRM